MTARFLSLAIAEKAAAAQRQYYGASRPPDQLPGSDALTSDEEDFIQARDSFYLSTVTETGWPYLQHRGGDPGFLQVIEPGVLAFADFKGNRQLISTGNILAGSRVALFLMDYPTQARMKILGRARVEPVAGHETLAERLVPPGRRSRYL